MAAPSVAASVLLVYTAIPNLPQAVSPVFVTVQSALRIVEHWQPLDAAALPTQQEAEVQLATICRTDTS